MDILIFITSYFTATLWEHYLHKEILHARPKKAKKWSKYYRLLYKGVYSHHVVHHKKTFQTNYHRQFDSQKQQQELDIHLIEKFGQTNNRRKYGLTINTLWEYSMFMLPWFFMAPLVYLYFELYQFFIFTFTLMLPLLLSKYIHPFLHTDLENKSWIYNNFYTRKIYKTHKNHHQDDTKNFNLLLGGDWIMGSYQASKC